MIDSKTLLKMWANSVTASGLPGATKPTLYKTPLSTRSYLLDEEVEKIEDAMTELFNDNLEFHSIVKSVYIKGKSCNSIARLFHCRTDIITSKLSNAEHFIRGLVFEYFKNR